MSLVQRALYTVAGLIAAVLQLLIKAAFGPGEASKTSQRGRSKGNDAHGPSQPREKEKQTSLSGDALVRLCRGLQEEVRRKEKDLTGCKARPAIAYPAGLEMASSHDMQSNCKLLTPSLSAMMLNSIIVCTDHSSGFRQDALK